MMPKQELAPSDTATYRHTETDDAVRFVGRETGHYVFRVNAERTMRLPVETWPDYREYLEREV